MRYLRGSNLFFDELKTPKYNFTPFLNTCIYRLFLYDNIPSVDYYKVETNGLFRL